MLETIYIYIYDYSFRRSLQPQYKLHIETSTIILVWGEPTYIYTSSRGDRSTLRV